MRTVSLVRRQTFPQLLSCLCAGICPLLWRPLQDPAPVGDGERRPHPEPSGREGATAVRLGAARCAAVCPQAQAMLTGLWAPARALHRALWLGLLWAVASSQPLNRLVPERLPGAAAHSVSSCLPPSFLICECLSSAIAPVLLFSPL